MRVYIDPTIVLVSTKVDDTVIETLESLAEDRYSLPFLLEVRPPVEFSFDSAKGKLAALRFKDHNVRHVSFIVPGDVNLLGEESLENAPGQQGRLLRLSGLIDMESRLTVRHRYPNIPAAMVLIMLRLAVQVHCYPTYRGGELLLTSQETRQHTRCSASQH